MISGYAVSSHAAYICATLHLFFKQKNESMKKELVSAQESPIDQLHQESSEWLSELAFWRDEVAFFYHLIKTHSKPLADLKPSIKDQETKKQLLHFSTSTIDQLEMEVVAHEKFLDKLLLKALPEDHLYRYRHAVLEKKFKENEVFFRALKKAVFTMVVGHPSDLSHA